ncbi:MAG TPA: hypothetical protein VMW76_02090 [Bacteroidales bacterium]|nr:hypothetical protein [Bacteroidales bacterium]
MRLKILIISCFFTLIAASAFGQNLFESYTAAGGQSGYNLNGFVRGGLYAGLDHDNAVYLPNSFSDLSLKVTAGNGLKYKAFADVRLRLGAEFGSHIEKLWLNEGWVAVYSKWLELVAGKQIVKWGRADMFNPTSKLNPRDDLYRSPDRGDLDLGNMMLRVRVSPSGFLSLEAVIVPFYSPSVMPTKVMSVPAFVRIENPGTIITDPEALSYAIRSDFHFRGADVGLSWFDGYNPLPGIRFSGIDIKNWGPPVEAEILLRETPYRINMFGFDGEASLKGTGFRWEMAFMNPPEDNSGPEYVPLPELNWVTGIDRSFGNWHIGIEYWGKHIGEYSTPEVSPSFPEADMLEIFSALAPEEISAMIRLQISSFNRLYNYQIEEYYHSAGIHLSRSGGTDLFRPELTTVYNFTTGELLLITSVRITPSDGISVTVGGEYWQGPEDSLYDMIHRPLNGLFISLRADF